MSLIPRSKGSMMGKPECVLSARVSPGLAQAYVTRHQACLTVMGRNLEFHISSPALNELEEIEKSFHKYVKVDQSNF